MKGIYTKCVATYPDKYKNALFGVNMELEIEEIREIDVLLKAACQTLGRFINHNTSTWQQFQDLLGERRRKVGALSEEAFIVSNPNVRVCSKILLLGMPAISVPPDIRLLYIWSNTLDEASDFLDKYNKGLLRGISAKPLGEDIKNLYYFVKSSS